MSIKHKCASLTALTVGFLVLAFSDWVSAGTWRTMEFNGATLVYMAPDELKPQASGDGRSLSHAVPPAVLVADPVPPDEPVRIPTPAALGARTGFTAADSIGASFSITYVDAGGTDEWGEPCGEFPEEAKTAFNAAAAVWGSLLRSSVPIAIRACWASGLGSTLGYSGGQPLHLDFAGAPLSSTWYQGSLANALSGNDLDPGAFDMHITYNSDFSWYYGTDGSTPPGAYDLMSVVLHEIAHGLNFSGTMQYSGGEASWGNGTGYPNIYDRFIFDGAGNQLINTAVFPNDSSTLGAAVTSDNLYFRGAAAMAANGGSPVRIYAPASWTGGSSYSHLDYLTFSGTSNRLMVYALASGSSIHDPGPVTQGLLSDLGWNQGAPSNANLTPYTPRRWSDKLVVGTSKGVKKDTRKFTARKNLFINWAITNNGTEAIRERFDITLFMDGNPIQTWSVDADVDPLEPGEYVYPKDGHFVGKLSVGSHAIRVAADSGGKVSERDKGDNSYTKTINVTAR